MSNNFKHTRTWRELLDEIPSLQWQKIAREPTLNTDYLIFKKLNKTLPLHRDNLAFKEVLPPNPRPPLERGKLVCIAVNSHPKPLELNYSLNAQNNTKNSIKVVIDYRVDDAIVLITEFDDALSEIEEYYQEALKSFCDKENTELSSAIIKNEIAALEVSQFGIFVEKVSVSNALEPKSIEEEKSRSEQERIAELEMALYAMEQSNLELKQQITELENKPEVDNVDKVNKKEEWLSLKKAKFLITKQEEALKIKEESLINEAERLAELEKRLQLKQSNQSRERQENLPTTPPEPPWLNNRPPEEEPDTFSPITVSRQVDLHDFEPIDYSEDDEYEYMRKSSKIKTVIFIFMVIIAIGVVMFYLPAIVALIKSLLEIG
jgi:hypothetical protein